MVHSWSVVTLLSTGVAVVWSARMMQLHYFAARRRWSDIRRRMVPPEHRAVREPASGAKPLWSVQLCQIELLASGDMPLRPADIVMMKAGQNFPIISPQASRSRRIEAQTKTLWAQMRAKAPVRANERASLSAPRRGADSL